MIAAFQEKGYDIALVPLTVNLEVLADFKPQFRHKYGYTQKVKLEYQSLEIKMEKCVKVKGKQERVK